MIGLTQTAILFPPALEAQSNQVMGVCGNTWICCNRSAPMRQKHNAHRKNPGWRCGAPCATELEQPSSGLLRRKSSSSQTQSLFALQPNEFPKGPLTKVWWHSWTERKGRDKNAACF